MIQTKFSALIKDQSRNSEVKKSEKKRAIPDFNEINYNSKSATAASIQRYDIHPSSLK